MGIIELTLVTAAIVLVITKSKILGAKREFVHVRYEEAKANAKINGGRVGWIHIWWHSMWTCPMCLGAWVAAVLCCYYDTGYAWWSATAMVFFLNWIIHCVENLFFQAGYWIEHSDKKIMK